MTVVTDTTRSPFARLRPTPIAAVSLTDRFWQPHLERNQQRGIPQLYEELEAHGVLDNFRRLYGAHDGPRRGFLFTDSDLYKWMEGAALSLQTRRDARVEALLETAVAAVLPAQGADGYLNTWFVEERAAERWRRLETDHELYCAGHLFQAAVAWHRLDGDRRLLDCAIRFANLIDDTFRLGGRAGAPGHPEIEMALVELYRETGEGRYLALATHFLEASESITRPEISGHVVRALYFMAGATDAYLETGQYWPTIEAQWRDLTAHKVYITGSIGARYTAEALGNAYELPNERAYAETCASVASIFWQWRLLLATGRAVYTDWLERTLYNGFLAGVSLSGAEYFYMNPLACTGREETDPWYAWARKEPYQRQLWHDCTCCPPNAQRLLASLPGYFYTTSADGLWVHLYAASEATCQLENGRSVAIVQETDYPWRGEVTLHLSSDSEQPFDLHLRIPGWAGQATVQLNGVPLPGVSPGHYFTISGVRRQETVRLALEMPVERVVAHSALAGNRGAVAVQRGPLVYCLEGVDHQQHDARRLYLPADASFTVRHRPDLLDGVTTIMADGWEADDGERPLYQYLSLQQPPHFSPMPLTFIPYYAWANRGPSSMNVWVPLRSQ